MAKYTEEQKAKVLARIPEIGLSEAAKEAGIPVSTVSKWNKAAKTAEARALYAKAEESASAVVIEAAAEADAKLAEAEKEAQAIVDQANKEHAEAKKEAAEEKKAKMKDKADATEIEIKKKKAQSTRKAQEKKKTVKEKVEKPIRKVQAAKMDLVFETSGGRQITPEAVAERVPKGVDAAYIKLEENKIYWVKGTETGMLDIWE